MATFNVTIDNTKVSADLTDYPVYIDLSDMPASFWSTVSNGGGDIRCYKEDGTTELAREVVSCDTATDTGELHVKYTGTLSSSSDTVMKIVVDGTSTEPAAGSTYGSQAVWSDYEYVYHYESNANDSTANGYNGTVNGATSGATGQIGDTYSYDGTNDYIDNGVISSMYSASVATVNVWMKNDNTGSRKKIVSDGIDIGGGRTYLYEISKLDTEKIRVDFCDGTTPNLLETTTSVNTTNRYKITGEFDGAGDINIYLNGSLENTVASAITNLNNTDSRLAIGADYDLGTPVEYFDGLIDEVRGRKSLTSTGRETTEYNNQNSPSTFYSITEDGANTTNFFFMM